MNVERFDATQERRVLVAMILDRTVLGRVASQWPEHGGLMSSKYLNLIGGWCVAYYKKHADAPGRAVEDLYRRWAREHNADKETLLSVEDVLAGMDAEYRGDGVPNPDHILDVAGDVLNRVAVERLGESVINDSRAGDVARALSRIQGFQQVRLGTKQAVDVLQDTALLNSLFASSQDGIVEYPGALGEFFGDDLGRDAFVSFLAPEKRGKTFFLLDVAWRATLQRRRTLFFQVGDLSERQMARRFVVRAAGRPWRAQTARVPTSLEVHDGKHVVVHEERTHDEPMDAAQAAAALEEVQVSDVKSRRPYLKMLSAPAGTMTVEEIHDQLHLLSVQGWSVDCVVIDYADLLAAPAGVRDVREKINAVWTQLRALSQRLHCLVVTATQSNRDSYSAGTLNMGHVSEEKRKLAHVTAAVGINQKDDEKRDGVYRLNWVVRREAETSARGKVHVAGCLALASPCMLSAF